MKHRQSKRSIGSQKQKRDGSSTHLCWAQACGGFGKNERWDRIACVHCSVSRRVCGRSSSSWSRKRPTNNNTKSSANDQLWKLVLWRLALCDIFAGPRLRMAQTFDELLYHVLDSFCSSRWRAILLPYGATTKYKSKNHAMKAQQRSFMVKTTLQKFSGAPIGKMIEARKSSPETLFTYFRVRALE